MFNPVHSLFSVILVICFFCQVLANVQECGKMECGYTKYFCTLGIEPQSLGSSVQMSALRTWFQDISLAGTRAIIKVKGHQHRWLPGGYDLEIGLFRGG